MKKLIIISLFLSFSMMAVHAQDMKIEVGKKVPEWVLPDASGQDYSMDSWKGKVLQINYVDPDEESLNDHFNDAVDLIIDGGSILFDPDGLDKKELMKIGFSRNISPRPNSLAFADEKLGPRGFKVPLTSRNIHLPDGTLIEDGSLFHRNFLSDKNSRKYIAQAEINTFIPCGGFKDTVNSSNVAQFASNFKELKYIVEGANVFFDDASRRYIAGNTPIKQIKDSTANKGGVFSSSIAEVLTAFLLQDDYEESLLNETTTRWSLINDVMKRVSLYARLETTIILKLHDRDGIPLFDLSEKSSEQIFSLQAQLEENLATLIENENLVWIILENYIPQVLVKRLGKERILEILKSAELQSYRNAIICKKISSTAYYRFGLEWESYRERIISDFHSALNEPFLDEKQS